MNNQSSNFFAAHYEWLALAFAIIVMIGAGVYAVSEFGKNAEDETTAALRSIDPLPKSRPSGVKAVNLDDYARVVGAVRKPIYIAEIKGFRSKLLGLRKAYDL